MRFARSHYQACLEADVLMDSSGLSSSKHNPSAGVTAALERGIVACITRGSCKNTARGSPIDWALKRALAIMARVRECLLQILYPNHSHFRQYSSAFGI